MKVMQKKLLKNKHFWYQAMYSATVLFVWRPCDLHCLEGKKCCPSFSRLHLSQRFSRFGFLGSVASFLLLTQIISCKQYLKKKNLWTNRVELQYKPVSNFCPLDLIQHCNQYNLLWGFSQKWQNDVWGRRRCWWMGFPPLFLQHIKVHARLSWFIFLCK